MKNKLFILVILVLSLSACATSPDRTKQALAKDRELPFRDASMMENSVTKYGISIAATRVEKSMQKEMFASNLESNGYISLLVTVTNNAPQKVLVRAHESLIVSGDLQVPQTDADRIKKKFRGKASVGPALGAPPPVYENLKKMMKDAVNTTFFKKSLREGILHPGQSVSGFVFFDKTSWPVGEKNLRVVFQTLRKLNNFEIDVPVE